MSIGKTEREAGGCFLIRQCWDQTVVKNGSSAKRAPSARGQARRLTLPGGGGQFGAVFRGLLRLTGGVVNRHQPLARRHQPVDGWTGLLGHDAVAGQYVLLRLSPL